MENKEVNKQNNGAIWQMIIFCSVLTFLGMLYLFLPADKLSIEEKRRLTPFPDFTIEAIKSGDFMDSLDSYAADHFPFRKMFMSVSVFLKSKKGIVNEKETFYTNVEPIDQLNSEEKQEEVSKIQKIEGDSKNSKGLVVINGQAFQLFTNDHPQNSKLASIINSYEQFFKDSVKIYNLIVPTPTDFMLNDDYEEYIGLEKENIETTESKLSSDVKKVNVYAELLKHKDEYIFYRTDHHWTALGAYYGYVAFCETKGITPIKLSDMEKSYLNEKFLGTHYLKTKDFRLASNPDRIDYWIPPVESKAIRYKDGESDKVPVYKKEGIEINPYLVFLGGDEPLIQLKSKEINNNKTILIVKNSYGNPFSPYFTANYENVIVMDYRYTDRSVKDIVKEFNVTDIVIVNGIFSANTISHLNRLQTILSLENSTENNTFVKRKKRIKNKSIDNKDVEESLVIDTNKVN